MKSNKSIIVLGNAPPPVHGQAVATQAVIEGDWAGADVQFVRISFSDSIGDVGLFKLRKLGVLLNVIQQVREITSNKKEYTLYYTPSIPGLFQLIRDCIILTSVRSQFTKIVHHFHSGGGSEFLEKNFLLRFLGRFTFRRSDQIILISKSETRLASILSSEKFTFIKNGVSEPEMPKNDAENAGPFQIVYLGNLIESKGIIEIIETARILRDELRAPDFKIVLCGQWVSENEKAEFDRLIQKYSLASYFSLSGEVHGDDKWKILQASNVFFFPSHYERENCPLVILEALAVGLPILSTNWRGIPEIVEDGVNGWLRDIKSPNQYADCLFEVMREPEKLEEIAVASRKRFVEKYQQERYASDVTEWVRDSPKQAEQTLKIPASELFVLGHFGGRNTGDEAMLYGFLSELDNRLGEINLTGVLATKNPYEIGFLLKYPMLRQVKTLFLPVLLAMKRNSCLVLCGGTHFHDDYKFLRLVRHYLYLVRLVTWIAWARLLNCRVELLGMGFGPLKSVVGRLLTKMALAMSHRVTVRDRASLEEIRMISPSMKTDIHFDLAANLAGVLEVEKVVTDSYYVGVSVTSLRESVPGNDDRWIEILGLAIRSKMEEDAALVLRIFIFRGGSWDDDIAISHRLKDRIGAEQNRRVIVYPYRDSPDAVLQLISQCRYFFATRYHSAVLGHVGRCRLGLLAYHRKVSDFGISMGIPEKRIVDLKGEDVNEKIEQMVGEVFGDNPDGEQQLDQDPQQHIGKDLVACLKNER